MSTKVFGSSGERYSELLLKKAGYTIIEKNFRCKIGEIDIIAIKDGYLVFIEVKTRSSLKFGFPEEAVGQRKIYKISRVGELYSLLHPECPKKLRIDVVSLVIQNGRIVGHKIIKVV